MLAEKLDTVDGLQEGELLLDVERQVREVHELGDPCTREAELANELGLVAVLALVEGSLKAGNKHERLRDTCRTPGWLRLFGSSRTGGWSVIFAPLRVRRMYPRTTRGPFGTASGSDD